MSTHLKKNRKKRKEKKIPQNLPCDRPRPRQLILPSLTSRHSHGLANNTVANRCTSCPGGPFYVSADHHRLQPCSSRRSPAGPAANSCTPLPGPAAREGRKDQAGAGGDVVTLLLFFFFHTFSLLNYKKNKMRQIREFERGDDCAQALRRRRQ